MYNRIKVRFKFHFDQLFINLGFKKAGVAQHNHIKHT